jgi:hypothetical protein
VAADVVVVSPVGRTGADAAAVVEEVDCEVDVVDDIVVVVMDVEDAVVGTTVTPVEEVELGVVEVGG